MQRKGVNTPLSHARQRSQATPEERWRMVAEAAYYRAEKRGFLGGNPAEDWAAAEAEVTEQLGENTPALAWSEQVQSLMQEWTKNQQRMWTDWLDFMENLAQIPSSAVWEKSLDTWQQSINNTLKIQADWMVAWTGCLPHLAGASDSITDWAWRSQQGIKRWESGQCQIWDHWFSILRQWPPGSKPYPPEKLANIVRAWKESLHTNLESQLEWLIEGFSEPGPETHRDKR